LFHRYKTLIAAVMSVPSLRTEFPEKWKASARQYQHQQQHSQVVLLKLLRDEAQRLYQQARVRIWSVAKEVI
jgi:hypothetical protein